MEWVTSIKLALAYIEKHLKENIFLEDIGKVVNMSSMFFNRGFTCITSYNVYEYIKNRRLYEAGLELINTDKKIIDIAYDYTYETPESFTKAFTRFHNATPSQIRNGTHQLKIFPPLTIDINIKGGDNMNFKVAPMFPLKLIGFVKEVSYDNSHEVIPEFWNEICEKYANNIYAGNEPRNPYERAIVDNCIGEYAVCIDDLGNGKFRYLLAGKYSGGEVPLGMEVYEFPRGEYAIFDCIGPNPKTIQETNARIWKEWIPGNPTYELRGNATLEWYDCINGNMTDTDYHSAIWIPVKRKK